MRSTQTHTSLQVVRCAGAPRKDGVVPSKEPGWAAASDPRTGRILGMLPMEQAEGYTLWVKLLDLILCFYICAECLIHDRACKILKLLDVFPQLRWAICDWWHGWNHTDNCVANPWVHGETLLNLLGFR